MTQEVKLGKVLFVDDDGDIRDLLVRLAERDGVDKGRIEDFEDVDGAVTRLKELEKSGETAAAIFSDGLHGGWRQVIATAQETKVSAIVLSADSIKYEAEQAGALFISKTELKIGLIATVLAELQVTSVA